MAKKILKATHSGNLQIGNLVIDASVLEDGTRVLSYRGVNRALGRSEKWSKGASELPPFLPQKALKSAIGADLSVPLSKPIEYAPLHGGRSAYGVPAELLPKICNVWLESRDQEVLNKKEEIIAKKADVLMRGFAHVGIIALVDEATGYQDDRVKKALEKILNEFLLEEQKKYKVTFPTAFYKTIFKLNNWPWTAESAQKKPQVVAKWTNDLVYDRLAPGLLKELEIRNPKTKGGRRKFKHFQFLTDEVGEPRLREHFGGLLALGTYATTMKKFKEMVERVYPKGKQIELPVSEIILAPGEGFAKIKIDV